MTESKVLLAGEHAKLGGWYTGGGGNGLVGALSDAVVEHRAADEGRLTGDDTNDGAIIDGYQRFVAKANEAHGAVASLLNELAGSPARDNNPFNKRFDDTVSELRSYGPVPSIIGQLRALEAEAKELRSFDDAIRTRLNHAVATLGADDGYKDGPKRAAQNLLRSLTLGLGVTDVDGLRKMHGDLKWMVSQYEADRARRAHASGTPEGRFLAASDKPAAARDMVNEGKLSAGYIRRTYRTSFDGPGEYSVDVVVGGFDLVIIHAHCFADGTLKPGDNAVHFKRSAFSDESWAIPAGGNPDLRSKLMPPAATIKSHREDPTKLHV